MPGELQGGHRHHQKSHTWCFNCTKKQNAPLDVNELLVYIGAAYGYYQGAGGLI